MKPATQTSAKIIPMVRRIPIAAFALSALLASCAEIPKSRVAKSQFGTMSCEELAQQAKEANATKAVADRAKNDSWHAILPFVVAARYQHAASASNEAEKRLTLLSEQSTRLSCDRGKQ